MKGNWPNPNLKKDKYIYYFVLINMNNYLSFLINEYSI